MRNIAEREGVYEVGVAAMMLGARRVLPDAVPPIGLDAVDGPPSDNGLPSYGWVMGVFPAPSKEDRYIVQFLGKREFRIFAYVDRYGRVFSTDRPLESPPTCNPRLELIRLSDQPSAGEERGYVVVRDEEGVSRQTGQYRSERDRYSLFDSWYDFGPYGVDLSYDDALTRAYLAFVYRPSIGASRVPARGIILVQEQLGEGKLLPALETIVLAVRDGEEDPLLRPPALLRVFSRWIQDAGLTDVMSRDVSDDALRLVRTVRYANTYYVGLEGEGTGIQRREVWALEAALNRLLLVNEALGDRASFASDADCSRWDGYLLETIGTQAVSTELGEGVPGGFFGGEWEMRCRMGAVLERLKLPFRVDSRLRVNAAEGVVALDLTVPDAGLMPAWEWVEDIGAPVSEGEVPAGEWVAISQERRDEQARRYAMHIGLVLAAAAFDIDGGIGRVALVARPFEDDHANGGETTGEDREFPVETKLAAYYQIMFSREGYEGFERFASARAGDPFPLFVQAGATFDVTGADPFAVIDAFPVEARRSLLPESDDEPLPDVVQAVFGADRASGLRVDSAAYRRKIGERIADGIVHTDSATEAIRIVREEQNEAEVRNDDRTAAAANRLMAALAEGSLDTEDQNAVVSCFLGEDRCLAALGRARGYAQQDIGKAVSVLVDAVSEAAALDGFVDGSTKVYRSFESYASRIRYNRALAAGAKTTDEGRDAHLLDDDIWSIDALVRNDIGKRVELVPDSFYLCHLEIVRLLEHSFERTDEALHYGRRAIGMAPATAAGYRQLGRVYMLVGDMDNAAAVLTAGLRIASQPSDIAVTYYQLAYALWKMGKPRVAAACYLKSMMTSPIVVLQATAELRELLGEHHVDPIERDDVDELLSEAGVVLAPTDDMMSVFDEGAAAATDVGMFSVARNLLSLRLRYRSDDALVNVLRSLDV